ncbi:ATP-dependent DNA/RNA helicase [Steccherinum ochraceum]|uniref:RNA helicase n=1 Tax=Steccherinum ochraceum TaxID=92696 RepID=A0A4R0RL66_9APHY|nr:ATP-dependent DNA/RNA helicase [Steccherinum ochraceum]
MPDARLVDSKASFSDFAHILDARILRALADLGFARPTLVQTKAIPLALENKDILARARTGSGKTAAYCIPVIQKILNAKLNPQDNTSSKALILVPTRELSEQVTAHLRGLLTYCADESLSLINLDTLVIDEADLILSYGHDEDVRHIFGDGYLPKVFQSFLMSATMTEDVEALKGLALRSPVILKLEEDEDEAANLTQYSVRCAEVDKFLLTYVIIKLKLVKGKCILFVNDVERSYRLKLFLEQFSIKSCVLNSELPLNSRYHVVQEFNQGVYDYIIASDESMGKAEQDEESEAEDVEDGEESKEEEEEEEEFTSTQREPQSDSVPHPEPGPSRKRKPSDTAEVSPSKQPSKKRKRGHKDSDKEYGVSRGVDFVDVSCVINFDLPSSSRAYTHRVGRTARAGRTGMALSFIVPQEEWGKHKVVGHVESTKKDEKVFQRIEKEQAARGSKVKEYSFDMKMVEAFRYRMEDALRAVTKSAIKEARVKELKTEILNSDKLKAHFEDNPHDLEYLRHDKPLHPTRVQSHMKHIPKYLLPKIAAPCLIKTPSFGSVLKA